jgi:hypothetical protein
LVQAGPLEEKFSLSETQHIYRVVAFGPILWPEEVTQSRKIVGVQIRRLAGYPVGRGSEAGSRTPIPYEVYDYQLIFSDRSSLSLSNGWEVNADFSENDLVNTLVEELGIQDLPRLRDNQGQTFFVPRFFWRNLSIAAGPLTVVAAFWKIFLL